jgi:hypothetical protein
MPRAGSLHHLYILRPGGVHPGGGSRGNVTYFHEAQIHTNGDAMKHVYNVYHILALYALDILSEYLLHLLTPLRNPHSVNILAAM